MTWAGDPPVERRLPDEPFRTATRAAPACGTNGGVTANGRFDVNAQLTPFYDKFKVEELLVHRSAHWSWSVRPVHSTLGAGVLSLNRYCEHMSDLRPEEAEDLSAICKVIEGSLEQFSQPQRMNYVMLMMVDAHLHFHVLPRYEATTEFNGRAWIDSGWPALPNMGENADTTLETLVDIRDALKAYSSR